MDNSIICRSDVVKCPHKYRYELVAWARTYTDIPLKKIRKMTKKQLYAVFYSY